MLSTEKNSGAIISEKEERLQHQLDVSERTVNSLQKQIANLASDANRKHNEQQNQLQGVEAVS